MSIVDRGPLRRDLNAQATRAELVRAARSAFTERGYASVRLDDVARAAHATTGAIYHHFGGKPGLMLAVGEHVEEEVVAAISARIPRGAGPWVAIEAAVAATIELCSRPEVARIIFKEAPNALGAAAWREVEMRHGLGGLQAMFRRAAAAGTLDPPEPALVTRLVMAALVEAVELVVDGRPGEGEAVRAAMERVLLAFRTEPQAKAR